MFSLFISFGCFAANPVPNSSVATLHSSVIRDNLSLPVEKKVMTPNELIQPVTMRNHQVHSSLATVFFFFFKSIFPYFKTLLFYLGGRTPN